MQLFFRQALPVTFNTDTEIIDNPDHSIETANSSVWEDLSPDALGNYLEDER